MNRHLVDEGRVILARYEPAYEYDLDVDGHNELLLLSQGRKHAEEFRQFADVLRWMAEGVLDASGARSMLRFGCSQEEGNGLRVVGCRASSTDSGVRNLAGHFLSAGT